MSTGCPLVRWSASLRACFACAMRELGRSLLGEAGGVLVTSMTTDLWSGVRPRFVRLLGRGDRTRETLITRQLDQGRAKLVQAAGRPTPEELSDAISEVISLLRTLIGTPTATMEAEMRALIAELGVVMSARPYARLG